jgi:DUF1365 family protein
MSLLNRASIHFGQVIHHRHAPENRFHYPMFYLRIPMRSRRLDPKLLTHHGVGDNRFSWMSFYDQDHGDEHRQSLEWVESLLAEKGHQEIDGEIWLHTFPRILGFVFNPVSFWFCHSANGVLRVVIAEVNNTFGERHTYILDSSGEASIPWGKTLRTQKVFHVSPFFDVIGNYQFRFMQQSGHKETPKYVSRIDYFQGDVHTLMTSVSGTEYPLTKAKMWEAILRFPILTMGVVLKIHWQAFKLWIKGAKFYKKPQPPEIKTS